MKENNKTGGIIISLLGAGMFFLTGITVLLSCYLYDKSQSEMIRIVVCALIGIGIVLFLCGEGRLNHRYQYDNEEKFLRFIMIYFICLLLAVIFPMLPVMGWPYLVIFVILSIVSNQMIGMSAGSLLLMITVLLQSEGSYNEFFLYFISGMAAIVLFLNIDENFKVGQPIFLSLLILFVCLSANIILFEAEALSVLLFITPAINIVICLILLLIVLKYSSYAIINRERDKYMEINDPECPILVKLKETSKEEYYQAIHIAYLSDKISNYLGFDAQAAKTCGYYHKIGMLKGENTIENINEICMEYQFPAKAHNIMKEYTDANTKFIARETVVVFFADTVVTSIRYLFSQDKEATLNYEKIIETIFDKKMESGILDDSEITLGELKRMKKAFLEETLYYDFLR